MHHIKVQGFYIVVQSISSIYINACVSTYGGMGGKSDPSTVIVLVVISVKVVGILCLLI